jgi:16S rRNA (uracil1498-N3)-methyltransferase
MRIPRIYTPQRLQTGKGLILEPAAARHLIRVLRLKAGAEVLLFNSDGRDCSANILQADKSGVRLQVGRCTPTAPPPRLEIELLQAVGKGERMDFALQKAVELGVTSIRPLFTERTQVRLHGERLDRRMAHWQQVVISACEQSGRNRLPRLERATHLDSEVLGKDNNDLRLLLAPIAGRNLAQLAAPRQRVQLLIGPEGGLTEAEMRLAEAEGFIPIRLGPRVLRTETAPLAAIAAIQTLWGDFCSAGA